MFYFKKIKSIVNIRISHVKWSSRIQGIQGKPQILGFQFVFVPKDKATKRQRNMVGGCLMDDHATSLIFI